MKRILLFICCFGYCLTICAQKQLDAKASDPTLMGWMQGFPPNSDRIALAEDGSFFTFPALRYSVCHMRQFLPTTEVAAVSNPTRSASIERVYLLAC